MKWTKLHSYASLGNIPGITKILLHDKNVDINCRSAEGGTPFFYAVNGGHVRAVELLVEFKANVSISKTDGTSPLHAAAENNFINIVNILLKQNVDIYAQNDDGATPLIIAIFHNHFTIANRLLKADNEMHKLAIICKKDGWCPLHAAIEECNVDMVELLLDNGADRISNMDDVYFGNQHKNINDLLSLHQCSGDLVDLIIERLA